MGKRSNFARRAHDAYDTPAGYLPPLAGPVRFIEPCVGWGDLAETMMLAGHRCVLAFDAMPRGPWRWGTGDALTLGVAHALGADCIVTNPPWSRPVLHAMIERFVALLPTWLLFDADWMHTRQALPHLRYCRRIVSVGRVKWMAGSKSAGKDNACWYLFDRSAGATVFEGWAA